MWLWTSIELRDRGRGTLSVLSQHRWKDKSHFELELFVMVDVLNCCQLLSCASELGQMSVRDKGR